MKGRCWELFWDLTYNFLIMGSQKLFYGTERSWEVNVLWRARWETYNNARAIEVDSPQLSEDLEQKARSQFDTPRYEKDHDKSDLPLMPSVPIISKNLIGS
ncbi:MULTISPECIES: hypothetical protein [Chryseobacterium]|uniref:hypothetical protein n=1 Tax=Chryseobacterium TaxID=59732 RepID=UPI000F4D6B6F|nr:MULTISPECIES: hypothetical protein [Chryseobacterium]